MTLSYCTNFCKIFTSYLRNSFSLKTSLCNWHVKEDANIKKKKIHVFVVKVELELFSPLVNFSHDHNAGKPKQTLPKSQELHLGSHVDVKV